MADIAVTFNRDGSITCDNSVVGRETSVNWTPVTGGTIASIVGGSPSPFVSPPTKDKNGTWSATVANSGEYTISGDLMGGARARPKSPRITVSAP
ncbi:MAG: hypothetical protein GC171_11600 [Terrimonas sp.]|nr:hypothetical protein [Terrimonas sp.]